MIEFGGIAWYNLKMKNEMSPNSNIENLEKEPRVEHLFFSGNQSVLIKTSFPLDGATASVFILINEPISKNGTELVNEHLKTLDENSESFATIKSVQDMLNKPLVFRGIEQAQEWFEAIKYNFSQNDRSTIARFLSVEDK